MVSRTTKLNGNKWEITGHKGNKEIILDDVKPNQAVFVDNVSDSVIQIKGKVTSICLNNVSKTGVVFTQSIGPMEVINSKSCQIQGAAPQFAVDKSESITLFVAAAAQADTELVTSLSSGVNITVLPDGDTDPVEVPVPSQFMTKYDAASKTWKTAPTDHVGA